MKQSADSEKHWGTSNFDLEPLKNMRTQREKGPSPPVWPTIDIQFVSARSLIL